MVPQILSRIKAPEFPNRICNIENYGAVKTPSDDVEAPFSTVSANTEAFKNAIKDCYDQGGGHVLVPDGSFITTSITLLSNIDLQVSSGAVIKFTRNTTAYPIVLTRWEGVELYNYSPFIYSLNAENISISGENSMKNLLESLELS